MSQVCWSSCRRRRQHGCSSPISASAGQFARRCRHTPQDLTIIRVGVWFPLLLLWVFVVFLWRLKFPPRFVDHCFHYHCCCHHRQLVRSDAITPHSNQSVFFSSVVVLRCRSSLLFFVVVDSGWRDTERHRTTPKPHDNTPVRVLFLVAFVLCCCSLSGTTPDFCSDFLPDWWSSRKSQVGIKIKFEFLLSIIAVRDNNRQQTQTHITHINQPSTFHGAYCCCWSSRGGTAAAVGIKQTCDDVAHRY